MISLMQSIAERVVRCVFPMRGCGILMGGERVLLTHTLDSIISVCVSLLEL
jgi:hypothetical protein